METPTQAPRAAPAPGSEPLWQRAEELFIAWRAGDQHALEGLVRTVTPVLWHVVRAYGLDRDSTDDVVQTTWLTLVRRGESVAGRRPRRRPGRGGGPPCSNRLGVARRGVRRRRDRRRGHHPGLPSRPAAHRGHGTHSADNPLFSGLELVDGPWFGHDIAAVDPVPAHVVLSSCELGRATVRSGEETLGMTAAWQHAGARTVVASPVRVNDDAACEVLAAHHARLAAGDRPAVALAAASAALPVT
ncbi:MAG: CHAT domain-containing protein, partial [Nocardioidaceae bacterium]|nr:CHAT domain-containing protein [Nocardioidaceae bacterium]